MKNFLLICICSSIISVLAFFAAISVTFVPGVAALYPATAFEAAFGSWFGWYGIIASYIGLLIAGTLSGWFSLISGIFLSISDAFIPLALNIAVRKFKLNTSLPDSKHVFLFVFAGLIGSFIGSVWYSSINLYLGLLAGESSFWASVIGWNLGNAVIITVLGIPLMRIGTPIINRLNIT